MGWWMIASRTFFVIACSLSAAGATGCSRSSGPTSGGGGSGMAIALDEAPSADAGAPGASMPASDAAEAGARLRILHAPSDPLATYLTSDAVSGKSVGHTSVVFKLRLEGGADAAYKPR